MPLREGVKKMTADAVVWVADGEPYEGIDYGTRIEERLTAMGLKVERRHHMDEGLEGLDAPHHFLTGGATSVNDVSTYMPEALKRTQNILSRAQGGLCTVTVICLGSQMIAHSLWPGSVKGGKTIEVGLVEVQWNLDGHTLTQVVPNFHYEEVDADFVRAGGGEIIASNGHSDVQAFRVGRTIRGMQFHPELGLKDVDKLLGFNVSTIETYGGNLQEVKERTNNLSKRLSSTLFNDALYLFFNSDSTVTASLGE